ncbi:hypothetical protein D9M70_376780 [compost metagenome]
MPTVARAVEDKGRHGSHREDDDDRYRQAEDRAEISRPIDLLELRLLKGDCAALRQPGRQSPIDAHGAERCDEGLDPADRGDQTVGKTTECAGDDSKQDRRQKHEYRIGDDPGVHEQDHQTGDEGDHRPDGEIEIARRNHESRSDRDDGDEGAAGSDVGEVVDADEVGIDQRPYQQQQRQCDEWRHGPQIDVAPAAAANCALTAFLVYAHIQLNLRPTCRESCCSRHLRRMRRGRLRPPSSSSILRRSA